jgi:hypothetical protein
MEVTVPDFVRNREELYQEEEGRLVEVAIQDQQRHPA